jgi:hypothetical protein
MRVGACFRGLRTVSVVVMAVTGAACGSGSDSSGVETVASTSALPGATITASTAVHAVDPSAAPTTGDFAAPATSSTRPREIAPPPTGASDATSGCLKELYDTAPASFPIVEFGDLDLARSVLGNERANLRYLKPWWHQTIRCRELGVW